MLAKVTNGDRTSGTRKQKNECRCVVNEQWKNERRTVVREVGEKRMLNNGTKATSQIKFSGRKMAIVFRATTMGQ